MRCLSYIHSALRLLPSFFLYFRDDCLLHITFAPPNWFCRLNMTADPSARQSDDPSTPSKVQSATAEDAPAPLSVGNGSVRPTISKWQTERPWPTARASILTPELRRHTTNTSMLNELIWSNPGADDHFTTSSSSSDDDGDVELQPRSNKDGEGRVEGAAEQAEGHSRGSMSATMISR